MSVPFHVLFEHYKFVREEMKLSFMSTIDDKDAEARPVGTWQGY